MNSPCRHALAALLAILCFTGCARSHPMVDDGGTEAGLDASVPPVDAADGGEPDGALLTTSIEGRFSRLYAARSGLDTWVVVQLRAVDLSPLPMRVYQPDYGGLVPDLSRWLEVEDTEDWRLVAVARDEDLVAIVVDSPSGDRPAQLLVFDGTMGVTLARIEVTHEGGGNLFANVAIEADELLLTTRWGLGEDLRLHRYLLEADRLRPVDDLLAAPMRSDGPVAFVDGEPTMVIGAMSTIQRWILRDGRLWPADIPSLPGSRPQWVGEDLLYFEDFSEVLLDGQPRGELPETTQVNGRPGAALGRRLVVAASLGSFPGLMVGVADEPEGLLEWQRAPADGLAGWPVAHADERHAGAFYLDTRLGARLPLLRYAGTSPE